MSLDLFRSSAMTAPRSFVDSANGTFLVSWMLAIRSRSVSIGKYEAGLRPKLDGAELRRGSADRHARANDGREGVESLRAAPDDPGADDHDPALARARRVIGRVVEAVDAHRPVGHIEARGAAQHLARAPQQQSRVDEARRGPRSRAGAGARPALADRRRFAALEDTESGEVLQDAVVHDRPLGPRQVRVGLLLEASHGGDQRVGDLKLRDAAPARPADGGHVGGRLPARGGLAYGGGHGLVEAAPVARGRAVEEPRLRGARLASRGRCARHRDRLTGRGHVAGAVPDRERDRVASGPAEVGREEGCLGPAGGVRATVAGVVPQILVHARARHLGVKCVEPHLLEPPERGVARREGRPGGLVSAAAATAATTTTHGGWAGGRRVMQGGDLARRQGAAVDLQLVEPHVGAAAARRGVAHDEVMIREAVVDRLWGVDAPLDHLPVDVQADRGAVVHTRHAVPCPVPDIAWHVAGRGDADAQRRAADVELESAGRSRVECVRRGSAAAVSAFRDDVLVVPGRAAGPHPGDDGHGGGLEQR